MIITRCCFRLRGGAAETELQKLKTQLDSEKHKLELSQQKAEQLEERLGAEVTPDIAACVASAASIKC